MKSKSKISKKAKKIIVATCLSSVTVSSAAVLLTVVSKPSEENNVKTADLKVKESEKQEENNKHDVKPKDKKPDEPQDEPQKESLPSEQEPNGVEVDSNKTEVLINKEDSVHILDSESHNEDRDISSENSFNSEIEDNFRKNESDSENSLSSKIDFSYFDKEDFSDTPISLVYEETKKQETETSGPSLLSMSEISHPEEMVVAQSLIGPEENLGIKNQPNSQQFGQQQFYQQFEIKIPDSEESHKIVSEVFEQKNYEVQSQKPGLESILECLLEMQRDPEAFLKRYILKKPLTGIDISCWNSHVREGADLCEAKEDGYGFAIIRASLAYEGNQAFDVDSRFFLNIEAAKKAGMPIGCYHYGQFKNIDQVREQANKFCDTVNEARKRYNVKIDFPLFLDIENPEGGDIFDRLSEAKELEELANEFLRIVAERGNMCGIYCSSRCFRDWFGVKGDNPFHINVLSKANPLFCIPRWLAYYPNKTQNDTIEMPDAHIWQFTSSEPANISYGASNGGKHVDANKCYIDFPRAIEDLGLNGD